MSAIGPGTLGALNLAGSLAGAQQSHAHTDRSKETGTQRAFQIDREVMSSHDLDDVAETDLSRDRDADGRMSYGRTPHEETDEGSTETEDTGREQGQKPLRTPDAFGERGLTLDLEA